MSTAKNKNEEEVDLGSLFVIIGKGFKNFLILLEVFLRVLFIF